MKKKPRITKTGILILTIIISIITFVIIGGWEKKEISTDENRNKQKRVVSIKTIENAIYPSKVNVMGEVTPEWQTEVRGLLAGEISYISGDLRIGTQVKKGEVLMRIEDTQYASMVAEAKAGLSNAKINLLMEQKEAEDAMANWKRSGIEGEPGSSLVLRQPQIEAARNAHYAAESALKTAQKNLSYTQIRAPFNGIIVERYINQGEAVNAGTPLFKIISIDKSLIHVYLSNEQMNLLSDEPEQIEAVLTDKNTAQRWKARVAREGQFINNMNRLRTLVLEVDYPLLQETPLLAGQFINVQLKGREMMEVMEAPQSSLTKGGFLWYVDQNKQLQSFKPQILFYDNQNLYFRLPPNIQSPIQLALNPNATYLNGMKVRTTQTERK